ncbi:protein phosphatase regulatory subunit Sds22 [Microsporum ferrugineum]
MSEPTDHDEIAKPRAILTNPEVLKNPHGDIDGPTPEEIEADEDLLVDLEDDADEIYLVHSRVSSMKSLKLERFTHIEKICLRQNQITRIYLPDNLVPTLMELDLYDNNISHVKGLDHLVNLTSLDLSFNDIKHIKNISTLVHLKDLYFIQNRIQTIEGLEEFKELRNLELGANKIREIDNLDNLTALEELWLGKNKISEIKNISSLTNLKILSLPSNRIETISGLESLSSLEELYLSDNLLTGISGLENNSSLRILDISNNKVSRLENLSHLPKLEELWASNNQLASFEEVERELKDKEELNTVYFEGNPLQKASPALYRNKVRLALPQIKQIDASKFPLSTVRFFTMGHRCSTFNPSFSYVMTSTD